MAFNINLHFIHFRKILPVQPSGNGAHHLLCSRSQDLELGCHGKIILEAIHLQNKRQRD